MLSMSYKSQTEVFARSLQTKLNVLNGSTGDLDMEEHSDSWNRDSFPYSGTTFPPVRLTHFDLLRSKFHSESDLNPASIINMKIPLPANKNGSSDNTDKNGENNDNDSDLFFDFDIGSPESNEDAGSPLFHVNQGQKGQDMVTAPPRSSHESSESSDDEKEGNNTAYGSASSGLCSDFDCLISSQLVAEKEDDAKCLSLEPEDWLSQQKKLEEHSVVVTLIPELTQNPVTEVSVVSPETLLEEPLYTENTRQITKIEENVEAEFKDNKAEEEDDDESVRVDANHKHKIAHSKLNALLALLDKDKSNPPRKLSALKETNNNNHVVGGEKKSSSFTQNSSRSSNSKENSPTRRFLSTLPPISDSPANFSFLSSTLPPEKPVLGGKLGGNKMSRCDSTPELTMLERAYMDSPQVTRKNNVVSTPNISVIPPRHNDVAADEADSGGGGGLAGGLEKPVMRRASSLKTGKTPPGTPGRRKIVKFADVFGLDLADVKTFLDEIPKVPKSAFSDLKEAELSDFESDSGSEGLHSFRGPTTSSTTSMVDAVKAMNSSIKSSCSSSSGPTTSLVPMFNQPGGFPNFFDLLRDKKVCLENAFMASQSSLKGTIRVQNIGFHKKVTIRYTTNEWISTTDFEAEYMVGSCDGFSDKFTFSMTTAPLNVGQRFQFCIKYETNDTEFWDSNEGKNYVFQCLSTGSQSSEKIPSLPIATPNKQIPRNSYSATTNVSHSPSALAEEPWLRYL